MKRRLFTILASLSLLLFVAVVVLWVRSYWVEPDRWWYQFDYSHLTVVSAPGRMLAKVIDYDVDPRRDSWGHSWWVGGFGYHQAHLSKASDYILQIPYWAFAVIALLLPAYCAIRDVRARFRSVSGLCPSCGYDLRATPGRCPECGLVPATPPPPTP